MLKLLVLASGSRGNAASVENEAAGAGVLIDCGICKREFFDRAAQCGFAVDRLAAIVVTHDHGDHVKGLGVVLRGLAKQGVRPAVYASEAVYGASVPLREAVASVGASFVPFSCGDALALAGMTVRPFRTSHDAADACGFRFEGDGDSLGYLTDSGVATPEARAALAGVRLLALESNHDQRMLEEGLYPYVVKQRIASDCGHLSNAQAAALLVEVAHEGLAQVVAMHISQENNTYRLPREVLTGALAESAPALAPGVTVSVAYQDRPVTVA